MLEGDLDNSQVFQVFIGFSSRPKLELRAE